MDISYIVKELQEFSNSWIDNVYEVDNLYLLKLRGSTNANKGVILIEPSKRLHLTEYKRNAPERPSDKLLSLRKHIRKGKITSIEQHGNDRIIIITIETATKTYQIINEIFAKGNAILIELFPENKEIKNKVIFALWYKIMRDRALLPGKPYIFPKMSRVFSRVNPKKSPTSWRAMKGYSINHWKTLITSKPYFFSNFSSVFGEEVSAFLFQRLPLSQSDFFISSIRTMGSTPLFSIF